jgi:hypothetical protein
MMTTDDTEDLRLTSVGNRVLTFLSSPDAVSTIRVLGSTPMATGALSQVLVIAVRRWAAAASPRDFEAYVRDALRRDGTATDERVRRGTAVLEQSFLVTSGDEVGVRRETSDVAIVLLLSLVHDLALDAAGTVRLVALAEWRVARLLRKTAGQRGSLSRWRWRKFSRELAARRASESRAPSALSTDVAQALQALSMYDYARARALPARDPDDVVNRVSRAAFESAIRRRFAAEADRTDIPRFAAAVSTSLTEIAVPANAIVDMVLGVFDPSVEEPDLDLERRLSAEAAAFMMIAEELGMFEAEVVELLADVERSAVPKR